jgi:peptide/nickel transport system substrate-binding protein
MRDIKSQAPDAICELTPTIVAINLLLNRDAPPFDNPEIRRAMLSSASPFLKAGLFWIILWRC